MTMTSRDTSAKNIGNHSCQIKMVSLGSCSDSRNRFVAAPSPSVELRSCESERLLPSPPRPLDGSAATGWGVNGCSKGPGVVGSRLSWDGEKKVSGETSRRCSRPGCARIRINVSGQRFETSLDVLERHPTTLLGDAERRQSHYDQSRDELFFDRHRPSFEAIFAYYQTGCRRLRRPHDVPEDVFVEEAMFFELEADVLEEHKNAGGYGKTEAIPQDDGRLLQRLWLLFEYPDSSRAAYVIAVTSVITTIVSIVLFCVETLPVFSTTHCVDDDAPNFLDPFFVIETVCTLWFTLEIVVRLITCPSKMTFCRDVKNIIDVTAILPYYVTFLNVVSTMSCASAKSSASLAFLRVTRLIRIFKLTKHSVGLQVLLMTFRASIEGLGLFLVALCVCLLLFSSAIYYAELDMPKSQIHSIPEGFWWAIITMTTVGYGDMVPLGPYGKLVGAACAICGVLTLAIPVPIITGHFNRFYAHKTGRGRVI